MWPFPDPMAYCSRRAAAAVGGGSLLVSACGMYPARAVQRRVEAEPWVDAEVLPPDAIQIVDDRLEDALHVFVCESNDISPAVDADRSWLVIQSAADVHDGLAHPVEVREHVALQEVRFCQPGLVADALSVLVLPCGDDKHNRAAGVICGAFVFFWDSGCWVRRGSC